MQQHPFHSKYLLHGKSFSSLKYLSNGSMAISKKERKEKEEKGLCLPLSKKW